MPHYHFSEDGPSCEDLLVGVIALPLVFIGKAVANEAHREYTAAKSTANIMSTIYQEALDADIKANINANGQSSVLAKTYATCNFGPRALAAATLGTVAGPLAFLYRATCWSKIELNREIAIQEALAKPKHRSRM